MNTQLYFKNFEEDIRKVYSVAEEARKKGLDPLDKVEVPLAKTMAEKCVELVATIYPQMSGCGIDKRILELEKDHGKLDPIIVFRIAEEVAKQKFCKFTNLLQAIEASIRIGLAYLTIGVVSSPIEGFTELKLGRTRDGKEYFIAYFSGPIRSSGTTANCVTLMLIDYLRELFGYARYDPTEEEVKRIVTENYDYHEYVTNLQYLPTVEEATFLAQNLPIQLAGDPTEKREVSNYKNLPRIDTNFIRGGMCLIFSEGLAQKAAKGFRLLEIAKSNGIKATGFDFIPEYIELHEKRDKGKADDSPTYIKDLVAGRPVFGHPSKSGGFRFRYGRGRVSGFSAVSLHPATMAITDGFIATGTQLKLEKPTKGCVTTVCDVIDGPIVKLFNGSVKKVKTKEEAKKLYPDVEEIIYLGDILFPFSDLANRNSNLVKSGYVEEWWGLDLKNAGGGVENCFEIDFDKAVELSKKFGIPLHPEFIFYWTQISKEEFFGLVAWLKEGVVVDKKIIFPYHKEVQEKFARGKRALEILGVEHSVTIENVVIDEKNSRALLVNLGIDLNFFKEGGLLKGFIDEKKYNLDKETLDIINSVCAFEIKDKAGDFIGARMGRPEKAKLRKLAGSPNILFPVGREGGRLRSVQAACEVGKVRNSFPVYFCGQCNKETIYSICENCGSKCKKLFFCPECGRSYPGKCKEHNIGISFYNRDVDIKHYYDKAAEKLGLQVSEFPALIKGVRGTSSENHQMENLAKGFLRAMYDLQVNKDGTIRFDSTELPLVSFKPKEISVGIEKLKELGYEKDIYGKELIDDEQILELMPHDVVLPSSPESLDERADDVFVKVCKFIDDLLVRFYGLKRFYNVKDRENLVGHLGVCMAPHNCAGVICRFIGFSNTLGLFASPYMHAAIRRDCFDYDTYIPIKKDGNWKIVKIGEQVDKLSPDKKADNFGTKEKNAEGFETISFDNELKPAKINNFTKHPKREFFEIKTALGKCLRISENHKFLVEGKEKRAADLKIGDKLPLPKKIKIESRDIKEINLIEFLKDENLMARKINSLLKNINVERILKKLNISKKQFNNFKLRDSYPLKFVLELDENTLNKIFEIGKLSVKRDNVEIPIIIRLTDELLEVIGLYIAEGYSRTVKSKKGLNQVYISSIDKNLRKFIEKTIKNTFGLIKTENKEDRVTFSSKILYLFFTRILESGSVAKDKRIPYLFLNLPLNRLSFFLRGYFEGDGSISSSDIRITCDSVSEGLLNDLEFCLARFEIFAKRYGYEKEPGQKVKNFYLRKNKLIPKFKITKLIICSNFIKKFKKIGFLSERKNRILRDLLKKSPYGMRVEMDNSFIYDPVISIKPLGKRESYCLNVNTKSHLVIGNSIVSKQCDGDEAAIMLLGDVLINFSREFLPSHRGGTQDAPLVLNGKIDAGEVDDQILDFEFTYEYPLELYQLAEQRKHSSEINIQNVKSILKEGKNPFEGFGFTHPTSNFNGGIVCSAYKLLGTMREKVQHQMDLVEKLRSADTSDTAKLIIDRHFIRDMKGNLRKFSMQGFRCVACNEIMRRPPLKGVCPRCGGKIIFTINEGGIKKYLEPALDLANKYNLSPYIKQNLQLLKENIDSIFGKELERQEKLGEWF